MQLLQHFKELTVNPKNAEELKGLILQLAIQGKLTANWREEKNDIEPASELLKRIQKEKEQHVKDKKLKRDKALPKLTEEETPFNIAETWVWTRLGEIGTTNVGLTYKPAHKNETGVPVLRSSNIQEGELCLKDLVRVNTEYREKDIIEEGDLLICARNGSRRLVGKCTIIGKIDEVMVFGAFMAIFRSNFNPYLQLFIQSPQYRSKLDGVETTTINQITQGNLKATAVPLPPLEEQKEIVNVVETLFKEVEQLEQLTVKRISLKEDFVTSALNKLTTNNANQEWTFLQDHFKSYFNETSNIKKLRETVLQLAVQGKLTSEWRTSHPELVSGTHHASQLLKRIQEEKAQLIKDKKIKKEKALPPIIKDEIPYELPEGWVWCRIIDVCERVTDGFHHTPTKLDKGIRYISATHIKENGILWNDCHFIGEKEHFELFRKASQGKGDVLIVNRGAGCGTPAIVDTDEPFSFQNAALIGFNENHINSHYMNNFILQKRSEIMDIFTNGGAQPMLSNKILKTLLFPFPPVEEQKAIVQKVNALMGLCDSLEQEVQQSQEYSEMLMQSCLREVFEGE